MITPTGDRLRILTLGPTRLQTSAGPIGADWLGQRPGQLLKVLVAARPRALHAEEIAETLWPGAGPGTIGNVRHFVHALRQHLDPARTRHTRAAYVVTRSGGYGLDLDRVEIDADDFEDHVGRALAAVDEADDEVAVEHLGTAIALYRGDFLEDEPYADWALAERDRLRVLAGRALETLGAIHLRRGDREGALHALHRHAALEPYDLDVQRSLIALCLQTGRRSQALRAYNALKHRMNRTFGEDVGFSLADLGTDPPEDLVRLRR
jgi:DNA-binding SARP family transcriptional activator